MGQQFRLYLFPTRRISLHFDKNRCVLYKTSHTYVRWYVYLVNDVCI